MRSVRIALSQMNPTVGDIEANGDRIIADIKKARDEGAALVAFPELAVCGYPPEDLLFKPSFLEASRRTLHRIVAETRGIVAVIGCVDRRDDIYNAAAVASEGQLVDIYHKTYLPNYGVFDEERYFQAGARTPVYRLRDITFGVNICEDIWYPGGPAYRQAVHGNAELIVNLSASPFHDGKTAQREHMIATRADDYGVAFAFCNMVGGQDELVFDGGSFVVNQEGAILARLPRFEEALESVDVDLDSVFRHRLRDSRRRKEKRRARIAERVKGDAAEGDVESVELPVATALFEGLQEPPRRPLRPPPSPETRLADIYNALVLGTGDYVRKNGFTNVVIGLSGGIDSALVAIIACDALGAENVRGVTMPSRYSSDDTRSDAERLAESLGIECLTLPIQPIFDTYLNALEDPFKGTESGTAEENVQPRIRGTLLMALSNKLGWLVLATGNKSEMSMGYATLYGDMAGGFAVIKDIYKTLVYDLVHYRNGRDGGTPIPSSIIQRPPTAELREDQLDTDTLPPYPVLDPILEAYVEDDRSLSEIVAAGNDEELVQRVIRTVDLNEYKRRQAPPGVKITPRAFGRDRRLPITNRCRTY